MARQVSRSYGGQAGDNAAERSMQHVALLKSLEHLYFEACSARISLVATLIGAAVEALKDDLAAMSGVVRPVASSGAIQIVETATPRMLVDNDDLLDDDDMDVEEEDDDDEDDAGDDEDEDDDHRN
jgi:hypothetical protein